MLIRATSRAANRRAVCSVFGATLLIGGAACAQPPRPAPPPVVRISPPPPPAPGSTDSLVQPDFSGVWVLNTKESDDPRPIFETMMPTEKPAGAKPGKPGGRGGPGVGVRGRSSDGSGMGGGGMGGGGMGGGGDDLNNGNEESTGDNPRAEARFGGDGKDQAAAKARQAFAARMTAGWQRLLIAQSGPEIEIIDVSE
jgi:hypothetical protein